MNTTPLSPHTKSHLAPATAPQAAISVSHDRKEESIEAKTRWFQSLSLDERINLLCQYTDMILAINPNIVEQKDAQPIEGRVLVLSKA